MQKLFLFVMASSRKHRCRLIRAILWTLRLLRDLEEDEYWQNSELMDHIDPWGDDVSRREYAALEDKYILCENAIGFLEPAIEDLEFVVESIY